MSLKQKELASASEEYCTLIELAPIHGKGIKSIEETASGILTRLDEYNEHLEHTHTNAYKSSTQSAPELILLARNLELLYKKIDAIAEYVDFVTNKVEDLDKKVVEIEKQETSTIGNLFGNLIKGKQNKTKAEPIPFAPMEYYVDPSVVKGGITKLETKHDEWRKKKKEEGYVEPVPETIDVTPLDSFLEEVVPGPPLDEEEPVQSHVTTESGVEAEGEE